MTGPDWTTEAEAARRWLDAALGRAGLPHRIDADPQGRPVAYLRIDLPAGETVNASVRMAARACRITAHGIIPAPPTAQALANIERSNRTPALMRLYPSPDGAALDGAMGLPVLAPDATLDLSKALALLVHGVSEVRSGRAPALAPAAPHPMEAYRGALDWMRGMGGAVEEAPGETGLARTRVTLPGVGETWLQLVTGPDALSLRLLATRAELREAERARRAAMTLNQLAPAGCVVWIGEEATATSIVALLPMLVPVEGATLDWALEMARANLETAGQLAAP